MFYSQLILAKKGPLGTIWIAAHLERKLRKNQVTETNISVSVGVCLHKHHKQERPEQNALLRGILWRGDRKPERVRDSILFPEAPIALRLSGHLLLGVVRIYSRKVNYLFHDCSEALTKIKQAFHSGVVDLPPEAATAPFHAITLPENFDLDELEPLPDRESAILLANGAADHHVTTRELITLQDPMEDNIYFGSQFGLDERFPETDMRRIALDFEEEEMEKAQERERSPKLALDEEVPPPVAEDRIIDYDRMDQMDAMDMDHMQPMTPAPPSMMDLDVEMVDQSVEQLEEFEQLAPVVEEPEQLAPVIEEPNQLAPVVEGEEQLAPVVEEEEQLAPVAEEDEQIAPLPITRTPEQMEPSMQAPEQVETVTKEVGEEEPLEVPNDLVPAIEAAADQAKPSTPALPFDFEHDDVPEVETLRSAVEPPTEGEPGIFDLEKETVMARENIETRDGDQLIEDRGGLVEDNEKLDELREDSVVNIPGLTSPRRRPSLMEDDLPADDDVLATLLGGRSTPALRVMPTPSEEAPAKRSRRGPKPPPRKRKLVIDIAMVLHGDVMREQLANTDDIRRIRKKAPCTQRELWNVQKQSLGQQIFSEPSLPGVCNSLRELYERMLVTGEADLPMADPEQETTPDQTPEKIPPTPHTDVPLEEPVSEERRTPPQQAEEAEEVAYEPAGELLVTPEQGAAAGAEAASSLQPERGTGEAQDLNQDPKEQIAEDLNKEVMVAQEQEPEGYAAQTSLASGKGTPNKEQEVQFPVLETAPEAESEPSLLSSATPVIEPILLTETEAEKESEEDAGKDLGVATKVDGAVPMEEEMQVTEPGVRTDVEPELPDMDQPELLPLELPPVDQPELHGSELPPVDQPELIELVALEADVEADALAKADEDAVLIVNADGSTTIVQEDGAVFDGPYPVIEVKEEVVEAVNEQELGFLGEPRETVFLDQDDDDLHEEAENYDDSAKDATLQGLGGWSARTRAVGGYLQGAFENLNADTRRGEKDGVSTIGLDHTLRGKSRKEAARMFFETLVLKTKDYIHVEQAQPFSEIYLSARPKLVKASF